MDNFLNNNKFCSKQIHKTENLNYFQCNYVKTQFDVEKSMEKIIGNNFVKIRFKYSSVRALTLMSSKT